MDLEHYVGAVWSPVVCDDVAFDMTQLLGLAAVTVEYP
jgi:hypothetical protein